MKEDWANIKGVCAKHAPKVDPRWVKKPFDFFVGKFVKKGFPAIDSRTKKPTLEHMWVFVEKIEDGKMVGKLNNDPIHEMELTLDDTVTVAREDIEAVMSRENGREDP
jgi:uncharacterized protein YegJ (DUF2314 family)